MSNVTEKFVENDRFEKKLEKCHYGPKTQKAAYEIFFNINFRNPLGVPYQLQQQSEIAHSKFFLTVKVKCVLNFLKFRGNMGSVNKST
jgi:hypothetical protein